MPKLHAKRFGVAEEGGRDVEAVRPGRDEPELADAALHRHRLPELDPKRERLGLDTPGLTEVAPRQPARADVAEHHRDPARTDHRQQLDIGSVQQRGSGAQLTVPADDTSLWNGEPPNQPALRRRWLAAVRDRRERLGCLRRQAQCLDEHADRVAPRAPNHAALEVAHEARADAGEFGKLLLSSLRPGAKLAKQRPELTRLVCVAGVCGHRLTEPHRKRVDT